jgi:predicted nucleotidyltransferase
VSGRAWLREWLDEFPNVEFALLFGSRAKGSPRRDSDWDVAVYFRDECSSSERFALQRKMLASVPGHRPVDLVVLNDAPPLLGHRALRGEVLLMKNRTAYVRYAVKTTSMALDAQYWRDFYRERLKSRARGGGFGRP